jgi:hypothetical protein
LTKWFWMIWRMGRQKSGTSMTSLQRMLEIKNYKTVWTMGHKIRKALADRDAAYKLAGLIEMDDTYFGAPKPGKRGRGAAGKGQGGGRRRNAAQQTQICHPASGSQGQWPGD